MVDYVGRSEGLTLFWNDGFEVEIQNYSKRHINAVIKKWGRSFLLEIYRFLWAPG